MTPELIYAFVSATNADLAAHRQAVCEELSRASIHTRGHDVLPPTDHEIHEKLRSEIEGCDVVFCLVGNAFGSGPVEEGFWRRSYTQMEYYIALELSKPVYVFMTQDAPSGEAPEVAALQTAYRESIRRSGRDVQEIKSLEQLRTLVSHAALRVKELVDPHDPVYVDNRFRIQSRLESRTQEDLFAARTTEVSPRSVTLRLVRPQAGPVLLAWFRERHRCWSRVVHPAVAPLLPGTNPLSTSPRPFVATPSLDGWTSIEHHLQRAGPLERDHLQRTFSVLIDVCVAAAARGIRLCAIDARDVWLRGDEVSFAAFGSALEERELAEFNPASWNASGEVRQDLAPELGRPGRVDPERMDVFGLGAILQRMRQHTPLSPSWYARDGQIDGLDCLAFHCLAEDPAVRFRGLAHLKLLSRELVGAEAPLTVPLVEDQPNGLRIGRFAVTNADYVRFCTSARHPLPSYIARHGRVEQRLAGPWLPVTCVNIHDAMAYARWLSERTGLTWRLPSEAEWTRAATRREQTGEVQRGQCAFPWGPVAQPGGASHGSGNWGSSEGGPTVVGAFWDGKEREECLDLGGNVWEWVSDRDPPNHLAKGGAYDHPIDSMKIASRRRELSTTRDPHIGFRLVQGGH